MKAIRLLPTFILLSILLFAACDQYVQYEAEKIFSDEERLVLAEELDLPEGLDVYDVFSTPFGGTNNNILGTIGRVLFYDKELSADGTIACASCHVQELAFSDNVAFSEGIHGNVTDRNSIALGSLASFDEEYGGEFEGAPGLFWDERVPTVKAQMEQTFANENEMGMDLSQVADIVKAKPHYQILFEKANFERSSKSDNINAENILVSIETFIRSITTRDSKFDQALQKEFNTGFPEIENEWAGLNQQENEGKILFGNNCSGCHAKGQDAFVFNPESFDPEPNNVANNGLDEIYTDKGVGAHTLSTKDNGVFKIPGLKNIALTGPYMHDGRFSDLAEVVNFYSEGIQNHENLHPALKDENGNAKKLNFSDAEKESLIAFLNSFTDEALLAEKKWSDPFKK